MIKADSMTGCRRSACGHFRDFINCGFGKPMALWTSQIGTPQVHKSASAGQVSTLDLAEEAPVNLGVATTTTADSDQITYSVY